MPSCTTPPHTTIQPTMNPVRPRFLTAGVEDDSSEVSVDSGEDFLSAAADSTNGIRPSDPSFIVPGLKKRRKDTGYLRDDGDPTPVNDPAGLFGQQYLDEKATVQKLLDEDPNMAFVRLVAGFTDARVTEYYEIDRITAVARQRIREAQQRAVEARQSGSAIAGLRAREKELEARIAALRKLADNRTADHRDWIASANQYKAVLTQTETVLGKAAYLRGQDAAAVASGLLNAVTRNNANAKHRYGHGARIVFDFATRAAVISAGPSGFTSDQFRRQIESVIDRTAGSINVAGSLNQQIKADIPSTSRLAFGLSVLRALVTSPGLYEFLSGENATVVHLRAGSDYDETKSLYGVDLEKLDSLIFNKNAEAGLNFLVYTNITRALYVHLVRMHARSGSLVSKPEKPADPNQGPRGNRRAVGGINVVIDIDDDVVDGAEPGVDNDFLSPQQISDLRNKPLDNPSAASTVDLLNELLQPMIQAVFPFLFYADADLPPDSSVVQFGGWGDSGDIRRMFGVGGGNPPGIVDEINPLQGGNLSMAARIAAETRKPRAGSGRSRRNVQSRFARIEAHRNEAGDAQFYVSPDYDTFSGLLFLAVGIFHHALEQNTVSVTTRHLIIDGFHHETELTTELATVLGLDNAATEAYLDRRRKFVVKRDLLPFVAGFLSLAGRLGNEQISGDLLLTSADVDHLRQFLADPDDDRLSGIAFDIYENLVGADGRTKASGATRTEVIHSLSNAKVDSAVRGNAFTQIAAHIVGERDKAKSDLATTNDQLTDLRIDIDERVSKSEAETKAGIAKTLKPDHTPDPSVALSPANTGVVRLTPIFSSALAAAHKRVTNYVEGLGHATQTLLQRDPRLNSLFAELVALEISEIRIRFPDVYRQESAEKRMLRKAQSIINDFRLVSGRANGRVARSIISSTSRFNRSLHKSIYTANSPSLFDTRPAANARGYFN